MHGIFASTERNLMFSVALLFLAGQVMGLRHDVLFLWAAYIGY